MSNIVFNGIPIFRLYLLRFFTDFNQQFFSPVIFPGSFLYHNTKRTKELCPYKGELFIANICFLFFDYTIALNLSNTSKPKY